MQAIEKDYILARAKDGQTRVACPACGPDRKTKNDPTLSIKQDAAGILWNCHHCGVNGSMGRGGKVSAVVPIKTYTAEEVDFGGLDYLSSRGISEETAKSLGICSGQRFFKKSGKELEAIGFPYLHQGRVTAIKWRSLSTKEFTQDGSAQTLFLADKIPVGSDLVITEGECFPGDAAILTPGGWVRFDSYVGGPVAQWTDGILEFVEPLARIRKPYSGNLTHLSVKGYHSLTTPGHRIPRVKRSGKLTFSAAENISNSPDVIPRTGMLVSGHGIPLTDNQIAFSIAVSADAKIDERKNTGPRKAAETRYIHFGFKKERKVERLLSLIEELGLQASITSHSGAGASSGYTYVSMPCPDWVPGRLLPNEWLSLATMDQRELILSELRHWDGNSVPNRRQDEYSTKLYENAVWVQTLCHISGRCSSIMHRQNDHGSWFKVSILHSKQTTSLQRIVSESIPFDGEVFCLTVPSGAILVRQDGKITVSGNCDALSFWQAGIPAVSIPSGALSEGAGDDTARLKWLSHHDEMLKKAPNVYLAVDMDGPGQTTANELARRIGKLKCWRVSFPGDCKDANDTLVQLGAESLADCKAKAARWPVEGLAAPSDYMDKVQMLYREGLPRGASTGWPSVDEVFTLNPGSLVIVTGTPGSGKSLMIDNMLVNAMSQHNWRVAYASFENPPELHLAKLISLKTGKPFGDGPTPRISEDEMLEALAWVNERLTFLTNEGVMPTVESLIERFEAAVLRSGVKAVVVDPFNFIKLSQKKDGGVDTESINEMLAQFKTFAMRAEITFFLIAHPAKPMNPGPDWVPTGYSIASSAHFYNRADFGLTIQRKLDQTVFHVWKCRFPWQGQLGEATLHYDKATGLFNEGQNESTEDKLFLKGFDEHFNF